MSGQDVAVSRPVGGPDLDRLVGGAGDKRLSVGREGDGCDDGGMAPQQRVRLAVGRFPIAGAPEPDRPVGASRSECLTVRRERQAIYPRLMAPERFQELPAADVPQLVHRIPASGGQHFAVGRKGHRADD